MGDHSLKYLVNEGEKVEVRVLSGRGAGDYLSVIQKVTDEGIVMDLPATGKVQAELTQGDRLTISYNRSGDASYRFQTVAALIQKTPVPLVYIAIPHRIDRRQLREFVRVDCSIPTQIIRADENAPDTNETYTGVITNISGGGMTVGTAMEAVVEEYLRFRFMLEEHGEERSFTSVGARVVAVKPAEGSASEKTLAVEFKGIGEQDRDEIVRFCLETQLHLRRQGKL